MYTGVWYDGKDPCSFVGALEKVHSLKIGRAPKRNSSSNHWFSGAILVYRRVTLVQSCIFRGDIPKNAKQRGETPASLIFSFKRSCSYRFQVSFSNDLCGKQQEATIVTSSEPNCTVPPKRMEVSLWIKNVAGKNPWKNETVFFSGIQVIHSNLHQKFCHFLCRHLCGVLVWVLPIPTGSKWNITLNT